MNVIRFSFLCFLIQFTLFSQSNLPPGTYTSSNKKAIKKLEEGKKNFEFKKDEDAEKDFLKAISIDSNFVEPHMALGYLYADHQKIEQAAFHFKKATLINPNFFPSNFYDLGGMYLILGKYKEAREAYEHFISFPRANPNLKEQAEKFLKNAKFGEEAIKNPQPFNPQNVGPGINSNFYEYFPSITADGNTFLFTRNLRFEGKEGSQEDFYVSEKINQQWQPALPLKSINSMSNEGAPSLSADGQFMFFVLCPDITGGYGRSSKKGFGSCDIFFSQKINGKWSEPMNVGEPINTSNWETQPSFSSDGKTLYFIRGYNTREGIKNQDIYMSQIGFDGKFSIPVKLGSNINSDGKEESVYIHPDNSTLYFSSDGFPGMGGLDIYMSKKQSNGEWGPAINLGYPINTFRDENSLLVGPDGKVAYFASERSGGYGGLDIYQFNLPEKFKPESITYVKGKVYDSLSGKPLDAAFELIDLETQQSVLKSYAAKDGSFLLTLTDNHDYALTASKDGYLFYSKNYSLKETKTDFNHPYLINVPMQPVDTGFVIELKNVFFDIDKFELKPSSKAELNKLADFMKKNPTIIGELGGHTDNTGDSKKNKTLSENRAKSVQEYLITQGINASRITYKGYGETKPKFPNDSPEHRAENRRTEFKVLKK
jgi:outer membrane protein OmpA-like peptidoglycan-associated protein